MRFTVLILGAVLIIAAGFYTLKHLNDEVVFTVLVPGVVVGLILIGVSIALDKNRRRPLE